MWELSKLRKVKLPFTDDIIQSLHTGDNILLSGVIYAARDAAHKRMIESLEKGQPLPFDIKRQTIYYMGPSPARPGEVSGAAGPTTSGRMDIYSPRLLQAGLKGMIGKGSRTLTVRAAIVQYKAVYMATIGGAGALLAGCIHKSEVVAFAELGAEAIRKLEVEDLPVTVINDIYGRDLYEEGKAQYSRVKDYYCSNQASE
jgi:fumarate hydratase subunit beta